MCASAQERPERAWTATRPGGGAHMYGSVRDRPRSIAHRPSPIAHRRYRRAALYCGPVQLPWKRPRRLCARPPRDSPGDNNPQRPRWLLRRPSRPRPNRLGVGLRQAVLRAIISSCILHALALHATPLLGERCQGVRQGGSHPEGRAAREAPWGFRGALQRWVRSRAPGSPRIASESDAANGAHGPYPEPHRREESTPQLEQHALHSRRSRPAGSMEFRTQNSERTPESQSAGPPPILAAPTPTSGFRSIRAQRRTHAPSTRHIKHHKTATPRIPEVAPSQQPSNTLTPLQAAAAVAAASYGADARGPPEAAPVRAPPVRSRHPRPFSLAGSLSAKQSAIDACHALTLRSPSENSEKERVVVGGESDAAHGSEEPRHVHEMREASETETGDL
ncbi:hypothetical protein C8Q77DRAFT_519342 [Trametes polyzona]|nr:hypothetical protein C8Q77DRAFT_519342 [Trametes polyzona]